MKLMTLNPKEAGGRSLYLQIYDNIKHQILAGEAAAGEKLPSLRTLSKTLGVSITTTELAYSQLLVEGYIVSRPQSGYYVAKISPAAQSAASGGSHAAEALASQEVPEASVAAGSSVIYDIRDYPLEASPYLHDLDCFDFNKWKKCASRVFNEYSHLLLFESDPQGEAALRFEIAKYIYQSRGVSASPDQIVIGAGTQQITSHLSRILMKMGIKHVSLESPGYLPVQSQFRDAGFTLSHIAVGSEGIEIGRLPANIPSAVYVSPSNQFPTGAVMPVGRRYELLEWARANQSIIIEDDYDSELRYFGRPVPALKGLDDGDHVVYLGSFSSTLFPAVKISYMVLPEAMSEIFCNIKDQYTQTCSKAEQLTLALFMEDGYYYTGIKKLRTLYSQKLQTAIAAFTRYGGGFVKPIDTQSGINLTIQVRSRKSAEQLSAEARSLKLQVIPLSQVSEPEAGNEPGQPGTVRHTSTLIFYYNQVPLKELDAKIQQLLEVWRG